MLGQSLVEWHFFQAINSHMIEEIHKNRNIRKKSEEPGIPGFSMPGRLGGVICKPEGAT